MYIVGVSSAAVIAISAGKAWWERRRNALQPRVAGGFCEAIVGAPSLWAAVREMAKATRLRRTAITCTLNAVEKSFGSDIDYAMLVKIYRETAESE